MMKCSAVSENPCMSKYKLIYLPLFREDLRNAVVYISTVLNNPEAADRLVDQIEKAILKRSESLPGAYQKYSSKHDRKHLYYKIQVEKYGVYYVVYGTKDGPVMEVRRFLHD